MSKAQFLLKEIYNDVTEGAPIEKIFTKFSSKYLVNYDLIRALVKQEKCNMLNELELEKAIRNIRKIGGGIDDVYQYFGKDNLVKKLIAKIYQVNLRLTEEENDAVSNLEERKDDDNQVIELNKIIEELKSENNLLKSKLQNVKLYDVIKSIDENQINGDQLIDNYKALIVADIIYSLINNNYKKEGIIYYDNY